MPKYVLGYHGEGGMPETAEEQEQVMAAWGAWFASLGAAVIDGGNPFGPSKTITADGKIAVGGGANPLNGYSVLQANDLDAAVEMAGGCPVLANGGSVEVAEAIDM